MRWNEFYFSFDRNIPFASFASSSTITTETATEGVVWGDEEILQVYLWGGTLGRLVLFKLRKMKIQ